MDLLDDALRRPQSHSRHSLNPDVIRSGYSEALTTRRGATVSANPRDRSKGFGSARNGNLDGIAPGGNAGASFRASADGAAAQAESGGCSRGRSAGARRAPAAIKVVGAFRAAYGSGLAEEAGISHVPVCSGLKLGEIAL